MKPQRPQTARVRGSKASSVASTPSMAELKQSMKKAVAFKSADQGPPHPTMQTDPKMKMLRHPPEPAPINSGATHTDQPAEAAVEGAATAEAEVAPVPAPPPMTVNNNSKTKLSISKDTMQQDMDHTADVAQLPAGWQKLESRTYPGMFYYLSPEGARQWNAPHHTAEEKKLKKQKLTSIYRADYQHWKDIVKFNPDSLNDGTKANASYSKHPQAKKDPDWGVSLKQKDHRKFDIEPSKPSKMWPLHVVTPFGCTSSYRAEYQPQKPSRPFSARNKTPPKSVPFDHNSTNRADFIDHKPKRPVLAHPAPQLHFNEGAPINSTNRADFADFGSRVYLNARRPRFFKDPGWIRNVKSKKDGSTHFYANKSQMPRIVDPLDDDEDDKIAEVEKVIAETDDEQLKRGVPVVSGKLKGDFHSTYGDDFVDADRVVPRPMRRGSKELDRLVVNRVKAHQDLRGLE